MNAKKIFLSLLAVVAGTAAFAVFNERNLGQTLAVLRGELSSQNAKMEKATERMRSRRHLQHQQMVNMVQRSNELSLMLYSQNQDFTFDITYTLKEATKEYQDFHKRQRPYNEILTSLNMEIDRYERLLESLRRLPPALDPLPDVPDSLLKSAGRFGFRMKRPAGYDRVPKAPMSHADSVRRAQFDSTRRAFVLDSLGQVDRDSCIVYAGNLLRMYKQSRRRVTLDSLHYAETSTRLKETYDYAQNRYHTLQHKIFIDGQDNYFKVLKSFGRYSKRAFEEAHAKYDSGFGRNLSDTRSEWRGPVVTGFIIYVLFYLFISILVSSILITVLSKTVKRLKTEDFRKRRLMVTMLAGTLIFALSIMVANQFVHQNFFIVASGLLLTFAWLLIAILLSLLIHLEPDQAKAGLKLYLPLILLGLLVITFRIIFIPNRLVNLVFPPLMLLFFLWQAHMCNRQRKAIKTADIAYSGITMFIMGAALVMSWSGYVLMSIQLLVWWLFQIAAIQTITAAADLISIYEKDTLVPALRAKGKKVTKEKLKAGDFIKSTWLYDLFKYALLPSLSILSLPFCLYMASDMFDLTSICLDGFYRNFFQFYDSNGGEILSLSFMKIITVASLFFVFKYLAYAGKAFYKRYKTKKVLQESQQDELRDNQINLTLANNLISIVIWLIYAISFIMTFKIPMGAISIVAAGLATGIGLALKDILNNFIYGIQLMSGRVRVGDMIECDGIRGRVSEISYQSTQIAAIDGSLISFTNTTLFNKNFKNLTRTSPYEFVKIVVGVSYGTDVDKVREVLMEALKSDGRKDKYGRQIVDPSFGTDGITVVFDEFADSSVNIAVKQFVIVEEKAGYIAATQEKIYNALNAAGIEIPFPQRDVHIKKD
ncbi:MAG: mechanosensitive ion channel family protein [Bacteroidales bacterium]|nr:mechanosensitive ion channel family protein [Bacteroidales bacterium]